MEKHVRVKAKIRALVLFSGGLDSRLVIKILQEQGITPICLMFKLPFGGGCCNNELCSFNFSQSQGTEIHIVDCSKGKLFKAYMDTLRKAEHGTGKGLNPCIDCRIFIINNAKPYLKKFKCDFIATGEVLGERPMSQYKSALDLIDAETGMAGKILRPLSAKLLPETEAEKKHFVSREKLFAIQGRNRKPQMALAERFCINYPSPGGGCLLCDRNFAAKLNDLLIHENKKKHLSPEHIASLKGLRHFRNHGKILLGRNHEENKLLEQLNKKLKFHILIPNSPGPTALFENKADKILAEDLIKAYSSKNLEDRNRFEKFNVTSCP